MDYKAYCKSYFEATDIPVTLISDGLTVYSSLGEALDMENPTPYELPDFGHNPSLCALSEDFLYGRVRVEEAGQEIILGPVFAIPLDDKLLRKLRQELYLPAEKEAALEDFFYALPVTGPHKLIKHLALLHLVFNGKQVNLDELYSTDVADAPTGESHRHHMDNLESGRLHNTYYYEVQLYQYIKEGNLEKLLRFFRENSGVELYEGKMAESPLRHAKNFFLTSLAKTAMIGAIPGGLDIEKTYQLQSYYAQACEKLGSIEAVSNLQYAMVTDFCRRVGEAKIPEGLSSDVFVALNYIDAHVNETVTLDTVAAQINRSSSYLMKKFREELGTTVGAYIIESKLKEAKSMLTFTDKTLAEISNYLCFSSQSYFQNVFKKHFGVTPLQYRKQMRGVY